MMRVVQLLIASCLLIPWGAAAEPVKPGLKLKLEPGRYTVSVRGVRASSRIALLRSDLALTAQRIALTPRSSTSELRELRSRRAALKREIARLEWRRLSSGDTGAPGARGGACRPGPTPCDQGLTCLFGRCLLAHDAPFKQL